MPRQKSAPKRREDAVGGVVELPSEEQRKEDLSEDEYDVDAPPEVSSDRQPLPTARGEGKRKQSCSKDGVGVSDGADSLPAAASAGAEERHGPGSQAKKPKKSSRVASTVGEKYADVGGQADDFDPDAVAVAYIHAESAGPSTVDTLGSHHHQHAMNTARLEAADQGKGLEIVTKDSKDGQRRRIIATFTGINKKQYRDECPLYTETELVQILAAVMRKQGTKRRKATASHPCFKLDQVGLRSPPVFWSIFSAFHADVAKGLKLVLEEAEAVAAAD